MEERILGRTGLRVRRVGFGGIPIQRLSEDEAVAVVRRCYELGVNFFDTARVYTTSEERMGKALSDVREKVIIATKTAKRTREGLLGDLETSLRNLQTDRIDLYQLHMVSKEEEWAQIRAPGGALEGLYEARDAAKIRHLGITSHNPELLLEILEEGIFETAMIPFNYLTPRPEERLLPLSKELGVGTIAMKPLGGGALSSARAALKYVLQNEYVDIAIPGIMSVREAEENIAVGSGETSLTDEELRLMEKDRAELGNEYCRACDYCKPCPQGIPISFVLRAENQLIRLSGWTPMIVRQIPDAEMRVASCLRCGECEKRCPYRLPIRELLPVKMNSLLRGLEAQKLAQNTS